jgi:dihydrolipoamide dehydrogenase
LFHPKGGNMDKRVDAAVIGAGTAGINAINEIRKITDNFVLINDGPLGTTCARIGCMPSKIMIQIGDDFHRRQVLADEGIGGADQLTVDVAQAMAHVRELRDGFVNGIIEDVIEPLKERFVAGQAEFVEPTVLAVGDRKICAETVVIATGSRPVIPGQWENIADRLLTTETIFEHRHLPARMAVIGMGVIGLELGQAMKRMGIEVTGVDQLEQVGGLQDPEVNQTAVEIFQEEMPLLLGVEAGIEKQGQGLKIGAGSLDFVADKALLSVGRKPNIEGLRLDRLGVELDRHGVPVYDRCTMQVGSLPVFIAGDAANDRPVLHEVAHEGTVAGYNAVHQPARRFKRKKRLTICFSDPNICTVGASWNEVKETNPAVGSAHFNGGREKIMLRPHGAIRIYADREKGRLLGAEMVAPKGEHLAHLLAWSMQQNLTVFDLLAMPFYHPTVEETLKEALEELAEDVPCDRRSPLGLEMI